MQGTRTRKYWKPTPPQVWADIAGELISQGMEAAEAEFEANTDITNWWLQFGIHPADKKFYNQNGDYIG